MKSIAFATAAERGKTLLRSVTRVLLCAAFFTLHASLFTSCSESEEDEGEFGNWQQRNEVFFRSLADSMRQAPTQWVRFKSYALSDSLPGVSTDSIYAKIIRSGADTNSPMITDSVRVSYQGRLIPSKTYPEGFIFDGTVYGKYNDATNYYSGQLVSRMIEGYATALIHMHGGDYWRVYIPYTLGYGTTGNGSNIPGYSVLVFDLTLISYSPVGQVLPVWN